MRHPVLATPKYPLTFFNGDSHILSLCVLLYTQQHAYCLLLAACFTHTHSLCSVLRSCITVFLILIQHWHYYALPKGPVITGRFFFPCHSHEARIMIHMLPTKTYKTHSKKKKKHNPNMFYTTSIKNIHRLSFYKLLSPIQSSNS